MVDTGAMKANHANNNASLLDLPHPSLWRRYEFKVCHGSQSLARVLNEINENGWVLVTVTQGRRSFYTVFFKRFMTCQKSDDV